MKVLVREGKHAWFEVNYRNSDAATFIQDTEVEVIEHSPHWYRSTGRVPGFPSDIPAILISKNDCE